MCSMATTFTSLFVKCSTGASCLQINGPFTPDLAHALPEFAEALRSNKWPAELKAGLIGSCTNSSYEDMQRAASVARQALAAGIKAKARLRSSPMLACMQLII